jgi:hypothetical protein
MAMNAQIGWSTEAKLLHAILKQLEAINKRQGKTTVTGAASTSTETTKK